MVTNVETTLTREQLYKIIGEAIGADPDSMHVDGQVNDGEIEVSGALTEVTVTVQTDLDGAKKIDRKLKKLVKD